MGAGDRHQKGVNIKEGGIDDVGERTTLAGRTEQALVVGDCCHDSIQKNGMVRARVELVLAAESVGGGQSTKLRPRQVSDRGRTDGRTVEGDAEGIIRPDTEVTDSRARLQTTR
jgi:hypothetical protein